MLRGPAGGCPVQGRSSRLPGGARGPGGIPGVPAGDRWPPSCFRERALRPGGLRGVPAPPRQGQWARGGRWPGTRVPPGSAPGAAGVPGVSDPPRPTPEGGWERGAVPPPKPAHPLPSRRGTTWGAVPRHRQEPGGIRSPSDGFPPCLPGTDTAARCLERGAPVKAACSGEGTGHPTSLVGAAQTPPPSPPVGSKSAGHRGAGRAGPAGGGTRTPAALAPDGAGPPGRQGALRRAAAAPLGINRGPETAVLSRRSAAMARGPKKHLKRVAAPKHWMLDKLTGVFAPRPSTGPHKLRECLPLIIFLRNRLKYALTGDEVKKICMQRFIKIDGKVRTDITYPAGFMDVISIEKTGEHFRLVYDTKGRFAVHRITAEEAKYKLCKVRKIFVGTKGIPHLVTHDARTIRYPDPLIKVNDTVQIDLETGKITDFIKFDTGNLCMVTGGANLGRIGVITNRERHPGSFDVVHVKDANGNSFATRLSNIFVIGKGNKPWISLPRGKGIRLTIAEERDKRLAAKQSSG
ncbi:small ribosomal subunit protein eS4, X isoform [Haliaeetus albicilla]|uniref:small ribosomal subunit protein eS4, X isoform n=1 Tax=Haliaeetus albicilla TaxID=8969 RepID=UPI0037E80313